MVVSNNLCTFAVIKTIKVMMDTSKTYTNAAILFAVLQTEAGTLILRGKDVEIEISRSPIRCTP